MALAVGSISALPLGTAEILPSLGLASGKAICRSIRQALFLRLA